LFLGKEVYNSYVTDVYYTVTLSGNNHPLWRVFFGFYLLIIK